MRLEKDAKAIPRVLKAFPTLAKLNFDDTSFDQLNSLPLQRLTLILSHAKLLDVIYDECHNTKTTIDRASGLSTAATRREMLCYANRARDYNGRRGSREAEEEGYHA